MPQPGPATSPAPPSSRPAEHRVRHPAGPRPDEQETGAGGFTPPTAPARYPCQAVPGIAGLRRHTLGDERVVIGVLDGPPDTRHPSLEGAGVHVLPPWWLPPTLPDPQLADHGTWTAGVLVGRPGSILPGLAPGCRALFICLPVSDDNPPDPISTARAIEEFTEAGATIIQITRAFRTASDDAHPTLKRAIAQAMDAGVLITAPAGNDYGICSSALAILPGVLAVGAHREDGAMFFFSNHGPAYAGHGITALGEGVLGATRGDGGIQASKGTCVSVTLVTGIVALLVSLQHRLGHPPDPLAVRDALLATARPCTPEQAHGQPERCLNGYLDLPAAAARLFPCLPPLTHPQ
ncbi:S8 family serine peptidase [Nonomuraea wenchangensis]|uniref:S8 family serine peptidase n=1 Tax=Nonomuraea wenchangensis TaxID=568860 RepID=UPI00370FA838